LVQNRIFPAMSKLESEKSREDLQREKDNRFRCWRGKDWNDARENGRGVVIFRGRNERWCRCGCKIKKLCTLRAKEKPATLLLEGHVKPASGRRSSQQRCTN